MTLGERFRYLAERGDKALVVYITAGDPSIEDLPAILSALVEGGADIIEIGLPFTDPIGDGPTIQASSFRALERGTTTSSILEAVSRCPKSVPLVAMGYMNTIHRIGLGRFAQKLKGAGFSGMITVDLIPEEAAEWKAAAAECGIDTIFLAAPTSTDERLTIVAEASNGFIYAVSRTGVTGASASLSDEGEALVARLNNLTEKPVCVGFGVSNPGQVSSLAQFSHGVVVGSFIVDLIHRTWDGGNGRHQLVDAVRLLKEATL